MKIMLPTRVRNFFGGMLVLVVLIGFGVWYLNNPGPEHIEDTNGADDYALQTITHEDVVKQEMGGRGSISESQTTYNWALLGHSNGTKYAAKKFTGVHRLYAATMFKGSDIHVSLANFVVNEGNFAFYVVFDGQVIGQVIPDETGWAEFTYDGIDKTGTIEYVIAGESANFSFVAPTGLE